MIYNDGQNGCCLAYIGNISNLDSNHFVHVFMSYWSSFWLKTPICIFSQRTPANAAIKPMAIFELLEYIVNQPPPRLPSKVFSSEMRDFVDICLKKNPSERPDLVTLMSHPWLLDVENDPTDVAKWVQDVIKLPNPQ